VHINYYLLVAFDLYIWVVYGGVAVFIAGCVLYMYRRDPKTYFEGYNAGLGLLGLLFVGGAFACYWLETESTRHITHSLWHLFGFIAIILLLQANRMRIFGKQTEDAIQTIISKAFFVTKTGWRVPVHNLSDL
jgi:predicted membrane channel-forming protein YqfA (hemolysin III family)